MLNYLAAKSEKSEGFATLDLQLFSEEETVETTESVEEYTEEVATEEVSEVQAETEEVTETKPGITSTQAFAHRLKEETARASQMARDSFIAEQYGDSHGIRTEAQYKQALYDQKMAETGTDPEAVKQLVNDHPDVKQARQAKEAQAEQQRNYAEYLDLVAEHQDIKDPAQIPPEVWQLKSEKGISLLDAQNRIIVKNHKAELEKTRLQVEQETIKKISKNAATSPGSASDGNVSHQSKSVNDMSPEEFEAYREEVSNRRGT